MRIGIFMNPDNTVSAFEAGGILNVYSKTGDNWTKVEEIPFPIQVDETAAQFRKRVQEFAVKANTCRHVVASSFSGIYRAIFEQYGLKLHQVDSSSLIDTQHLLNNIAATIKVVKSPVAEPALGIRL